jgi:hypothetical protein
VLRHTWEEEVIAEIRGEVPKYKSGSKENLQTIIGKSYSTQAV